MSEEVDEDGEKTGEVLVTNKGTIPSVFSNPKWNQLYKGTVLITCNGSFINPSPTHVGNVGDLDDIKKRVKAKLTTKLIATRISGPEENINPITVEERSVGLKGI